MPRTALYLDYGEPIAWDMHADKYTEPDARPLLMDCELGQRLGEGAFGAAFRVTRPDGEDNEWVVKLPVDLLSQPALDQYPIPLSEAIEPFATIAERTKAREMFVDEFRNAETILEPPVFRTLNAPGGRILRMPAADWERIQAARERWWALPGYTHLHPMLHIEPNVPMLISAAAEGTLYELRARVEYERALRMDGPTPSATWTGFARQITSAVAFILAYTPLAHVDIKPENILYRHTDAHTLLLQLSDYGLCASKGANVRAYWIGTRAYNPEVPDAGLPILFTYGSLSIFQLCTTLLDLLHLPNYDGTPGRHYITETRLWTVCAYVNSQRPILSTGEFTGVLNALLCAVREAPNLRGADGRVRTRFAGIKRLLSIETPVFMEG